MKESMLTKCQCIRSALLAILSLYYSSRVFYSRHLFMPESNLLSLTSEFVPTESHFTNCFSSSGLYILFISLCLDWTDVVLCILLWFWVLYLPPQEGATISCEHIRVLCHISGLTGNWSVSHSTNHFVPHWKTSANAACIDIWWRHLCFPAGESHRHWWSPEVSI